MEYSNAAQNTVADKGPQLGRLKAAAERIARAGINVENFLARFHGPASESAAKEGPTQDSYRNDLDSIFAALDRLEGFVAALDNIG